MKTKPPRFDVLASAAIARHRRTQCVVVLKSGGQFPDTLSAQELLPGWQMGGGVIGPPLLVLYLWLCLLYSLLLVCCRLSKGNTFYLLFLRDILKSGLLRLTTWCDILSCSHYLHFLVSGHHRFDDLIDKEVDFIENCRKCLGQAETEKQNIENTHTSGRQGLFMQLWARIWRLKRSSRINSAKALLLRSEPSPVIMLTPGTAPPTPKLISKLS